MNATRNRKIALTALFTAASLVVSFVQIPIFPAAPWLKFDPSGLVCLLAALCFGPKLGTAVAIISWLPRIFWDPWGMVMGMLSTCAIIIPASIIAGSGKKDSDFSYARALVGMIVGAVVSVAATCAMNIVITPLYTAVSTADVIAMIVPILLPFNALKMLITVVAGAVLVRPVQALVGAVDAA